jgi:hypothetical protein
MRCRVGAASRWALLGLGRAGKFVASLDAVSTWVMAPLTDEDQENTFYRDTLT